MMCWSHVGLSLSSSTIHVAANLPVNVNSYHQTPRRGTPFAAPFSDRCNKLASLDSEWLDGEGFNGHPESIPAVNLLMQ